MNTEKDIGGLAEADLHRWAKQVSITSNPSIEDKEGWDFILEFPSTSIERLPLDQRDLQIELKIQVKGVSESRKRVGIKLSNLEKMAKSKLPAFYLIIIYGKEDDAKAAYLIHFGEELITRTLRKLREVSSQCKDPRLNKKHLYLSWKELEKINELNGKALRDSILSHIGDNTRKYILWKQEVIKNVGNPIHSVIKPTMQFNDADEMYSTLVDLSLGLRQNVETIQVVIQENLRFDIPEKSSNLTGGILSIETKPSTEVKLIMRDEGNKFQAEIIGQLFSPLAFFPDGKLPEEYLKLRVFFPFGEVIFDPKDKRADFKLKIAQISDTRSIMKQYRIWKVPAILHLGRNGNGCYLEIKTMEGVSLGTANIPSQDIPEIPQALLMVFKSIDNLWFIVRNFDLSYDTKVTIEEAARLYPTSNFIRSIFDAHKDIRTITGELMNPSEKINKIAIPFYKELPFGERLLIVHGALCGKMFIEEDNVTYRIENPKTNLLSSKVILMSEKPDKEEILDQLYKSLNNKGFDYIVFDE